jgi:hypothetical protein
MRFKVTKGSEGKPQPGMPPAEPKWLAVPILPELREILAATPSGHFTYLATKFGKPFSVAGLGNWFRDQCNAAGLPPLFRTRHQEVRRDSCCRSKCNRAPADGLVWMG